MCEKEKISGKKDWKDNYAFHFLNDVEHPVVRLNAVGKERCSTDAYYWDNSRRPDCYLFQYTLNGSGMVRIEGEELMIRKGTGFFLKMPGPECYYFDEKNLSICFLNAGRQKNIAGISKVIWEKLLSCQFTVWQWN